MKKHLLLSLLVLLGSIVFAQETIKVMTYNLLNFGNYPSYCSESVNSIEDKAGYLGTIVGSQELDILAVCELGKTPSSSYTTNYILGNSLNTNGETRWVAASPTDISGSYLINGFFYDKNKFMLVGQPVISTDVRDINVYKLKCLNQTEDIYFNVVVMHLKAGNDDQAARGAMVGLLMDYFESLGTNENYIVVGDFNVYTSTESAFQKLVNPSDPSLSFYDPIDQLGYWNDYDYRQYHTQSTHDDSSEDCYSYGGFDDRFDFILISSSIKDNTADVSYVDDSYWAVGQDGNRYNDDLLDGSNNTLPYNVISALYNMSDHLPVVAEFQVGDGSGRTSLSANSGFYANVINPANDEIRYELKTNLTTEINMSIFTLVGQELFSETVNLTDGNVFSHDISNLPQGAYVMIFEGEGVFQSYRFIKQ